jgi:preprotein translocase subunit SecG
MIAYYIVSVFYVLVCLLLLLVILLQQGKGGDMASAFGGGGSQTAFGPWRRHALTKMTSVRAVLMPARLSSRFSASGPRSLVAARPRRGDDAEDAPAAPAATQPATPPVRQRRFPRRPRPPLQHLHGMTAGLKGPAPCSADPFGSAFTTHKTTATRHPGSPRAVARRRDLIARRNLTRR